MANGHLAPTIGILQMMPKMKAVQVSAPGADFQVVERDIPEPGAGEVRIKVQACGVCHGDILVKDGLFPGIQYPRVPGHEIAGVIDKIGSNNAATWSPGQRVGVGWHGLHCGYCVYCRHGDFPLCVNLKITGIHFDGGYQEYMIAPAQALAQIPEEIGADAAAPIMCAGMTTYNSLRNSGARGGDVVAVQALGGLGHLGVQYASKLGFHTVAISRGKDKKELALRLGAKQYIDAETQDPADALMRLGGAKVILSTAPNSKAMSPLVHGLSPGGMLLVVGAGSEAIEVAPLPLISGRKSIRGWPSGSAADSDDTLRFSALTGVRPMIETFPLARAAEGYERMLSNKARFRIVLTMD